MTAHLSLTIIKMPLNKCNYQQIHVQSIKALCDNHRTRKPTNFSSSFCCFTETEQQQQQRYSPTTHNQNMVLIPHILWHTSPLRPVPRLPSFPAITVHSIAPLRYEFDIVLYCINFYVPHVWLSVFSLTAAVL
jgi:hypothetical protein